MKMESIEAKIKKAEERVVKTGETYNAACEELKNLRNKRIILILLLMNLREKLMLCFFSSQNLERLIL